VDIAFLTALEQEVLNPKAFSFAVDKAMRWVQAQLREDPGRVRQLERRKAALRQQIERLVGAIAEGRGPASIVKEIERAEAEVKENDIELTRLTSGAAVTELDLKRIEREISKQLGRFTELLRGNVPRARQALKKLLADAVVLSTVSLADGREAYAFEGTLQYGAVIREVICTQEKPPGVYMGKKPLGTPQRNAGL
jgi:hypothetical protein